MINFQFMESNWLKQAKLLGGLGVIFLLLGAIPYIGFVLVIAGLVMLILANKTLAKILSNPEIYKNTLWGIIGEVIGEIIALLLFVSSLAGMSSYSSDAQAVGGLTLFIGFVILYASLVGGSYFLKKAFDEIAKAFNSDLMAWGGKLIFWGAIGLIVFGLGSIAMLIGWILVAIAYFTLPETIPNNSA